MGLVDGHQSDFGVGQDGLELCISHAFRGDEQHFELTASDIVIDALLFGIAHGGVESGGPDALADEGVDLIFHQGDEWGDDQGQSWSDDAWQLVAEAFSAARGHDGQGVMVHHDTAHDVFLSLSKSREAECVF